MLLSPSGLAVACFLLDFEHFAHLLGKARLGSALGLGLLDFCANGILVDDELLDDPLLAKG